jgi:hypothetical protein
MTPTRARMLARKARETGYFDTVRTLWLKCPTCRERVECDRDSVYRTTIVKQLDRMMVDHLTNYCEGES